MALFQELNKITGLLSDFEILEISISTKLNRRFFCIVVVNSRELTGRYYTILPMTNLYLPIKISLQLLFRPSLVQKISYHL
jgi:hypothetical protein